MEKMTYVKALETAIACEALSEEVREKLSALAVQQAKRSGGSGSRKPTAQQTANEGYKMLIIGFLANGEKRTITEMVKGIDWGEGVEMSQNRCSALVRQLKESGTVVREEIKRKAYFSLAAEDDGEDDTDQYLGREITV